MPLSILLLSLICTSFVARAVSETITIHKTEADSAIRKALAQASNGDTVVIHGGHYYVKDLQITKQIVFKGMDNPVLDGDKKDAILQVSADNVTISGFILQNAGVSFIEDNAAIKLNQVKNVIIENNILVDNFFAIYLAKSENCIVRNNRIESHHSRQTSAGNGIHLWYCKDISILNNKIRGHRDGIYFEFVEKGYIEGNYSEANLRYGLHFMFSDDCRYVNNTFYNNGAGVAVMYTKRVLMESNFFEHNWGPASYGLLLKEINDSTIRKNRFKNNTTALYTESSNRLQIENNVFEGNGWAIKIMANSMDNYFTANDFLNNSFMVATNSRQNFNTFNGNYWQDYDGYDLDKDGTGDVPYRPVGLFSIIVEKQHPALILLKSFFIRLLDVAESILPVLSPETLVDESPKMRIIN
jgi:nitrous oxidase accessory protein